jgi:hypothetical protein
MKKLLLTIFLTCVLGLGIFTLSQVLKPAQVTNYEVTTVNNHSDKEILGKTDDGEYLQFILWDAKTQSKYKTRVTSDDYDLYKVGESFDTDTFTPAYR